MVGAVPSAKPGSSKSNDQAAVFEGAMRILKGMSSGEINEAQQELASMLSPDILGMLKRKGRSKVTARCVSERTF